MNSLEELAQGIEAGERRMRFEELEATGYAVFFFLF